MIRKSQIIFCDNEHGTGDVTFPDLDAMSIREIQEVFINARPISQLRNEAKKSGWGRLNGGDYCPGCMESM